MQRLIRVTDPAKTYFISDPHFNHKHPEILALAGVKTVEELNVARLAAWNAAVPEDGVVFMLGDFCLHDPDGSISRAMLRRLNGKIIYIIWGNHNSGLKKLYREELVRFFDGSMSRADNYEVYPLKVSIGDKSVIFVGSYQVLLRELNGEDQKVILSHYAFRNWWHSEKGAYMLCGHSHGGDADIAAQEDRGIGRIQEVTFEVVGQPRNLVEIDQIMQGKKTRGGHNADQTTQTVQA